MGKRSRQEHDGSTSSKKKRRTSDVNITSTTNGNEDHAGSVTEPVFNGGGDVAADSVPISISTSDEKKRRKDERRAAKALKRAAKEVSAQPERNETTEKATPDAGGLYSQDVALTALPESEVEEFLGKHFISITGPQSKDLRPVLRFNYLPSDCKHASMFGSFTEPTPVQGAAWPFLLAGRDVIGIAETGSGKTLAFGVPCVRHVRSKMQKEHSKIRAVIVSPTRELALQIHEQMTKLVANTEVRVVCIYGGVGKDPQRTALYESQIVIATPGRLMDFIQEGSADLSHVSYFVLDEADRMLEKGFEQDMRTIASAMPTGKVQTAMFTATWPASIRELAEQFMKDPVKIAIGDNPDGDLRANVRVTQKVEVIEPHDKEQRLMQLLKQYQSGKQKTDRILVFCLYKKEAARIERLIRSRGLNVAGIHGDLSQEARTSALNGFRDGSVPLLVATDVAARGLDIPNVRAVINVTCEYFDSLSDWRLLIPTKSHSRQRTMCTALEGLEEQGRKV